LKLSALRRAMIDGDIKGRSVMSGQSVGMVTEIQSVADILRELRAQAVAALRVRSRMAFAEGV
jgi:enoyl-[acyl-carrier protein] reductase II